MSRGSAQRIADVLEAIERCQRYAAALGGDAGVVGVAEDAIECNLQIIGEAVNHLPEDITAAHPGFPGRRSGVSATSSSTSTSGSTPTSSAMWWRLICHRLPTRCGGTFSASDLRMSSLRRSRGCSATGRGGVPGQRLALMTVSVMPWVRDQIVRRSGD